MLENQGSAPMLTPNLPDKPAAILAECAVCLSSFLRRLEQAGYPFAAPPNARQLIEKIDAHIESLQAAPVKGMTRDYDIPKLCHSTTPKNSR